MQSQPAKFRARTGWVLFLVLLLLCCSAGKYSAALPPAERRAPSALQARPPTLPDPPTLLSPIDGSNTCGFRPLFTWSRVKKAAWYHVQVDDGPGFDSPDVDRTTTDTSLMPESDLGPLTYHWRVRAASADVTGTWSAAWTVTLLPFPTDTTLLSPADGSRTCDTTPTLDWTPANDATSYQVQVDSNPSFDKPEVDAIAAGPGYTLETALAPGAYFWRVRASNACGDGPWSPTFALTVLSIPPVPLLLTPDNNSSTLDRTPTLTWESTGEAPWQYIQIDDSESLNSPLINEWVPSTAFTPSDALSNGTYYWRVQASNTCGSSEWSDHWSFGVSNQAPAANDDRLTVDEDSGDNTLDVLANDTDANEDSIRIVAVTDPTLGTVAIVDSGTRLQYRPDPDAFGWDHFEYTIDDDNGGTNTAGVDIDVVGVNDPPDAQNDLAVTDEDTPITVDVLANDRDVDGQLDALTVQVVAGPANGSARVHATNGTITYSPALNWNGGDSLVYLACDDGTPLPPRCDTAVVEITVRSVNDPPIADAGPDQVVPTSATVALDGTRSYDPDGDLSLRHFWTQSSGPPVQLSSTIVPTPTFTAPEEPGMLAFKLFVIDSQGALCPQPAQVSITVIRLPVFRTYLPLFAHKHATAPDLIVQSITAARNNVRLVILNQGNAPVHGEFFVDAYINPRAAPTAVNQTWDKLGSQGLVWAITQDVLWRLAPGGALTLNVNDAHYVRELSSFSGSLPVGTVVYAQVDSYNPKTTYGNVLEEHEITGGAYNNIRGPVYSTAADMYAGNASERFGR
jgi:hypothetical protein